MSTSVHQREQHTSLLVPCEIGHVHSLTKGKLLYPLHSSCHRGSNMMCHGERRVDLRCCWGTGRSTCPMRMKKQDAGSLKLLLAGDVMLGRLVNEILEVELPAYPWGDTLPLFQDADVRLCNLESVISDRGTPWSATPKMFHFRSDAKNVAVLNAAHIDAVSLANNHVLDYD